MFVAPPDGVPGVVFAGMSTYSGKLNGPGYPDPKDNKTYDGPEIIETIANATQVGLGGPGVRASAWGNALSAARNSRSLAESSCP